MVNSPRWVIFQNELWNVIRHDRQMLYIVKDYEFMWHNDNKSAEQYYIAVLQEDCTPITDEVAQIMRSV